jgi:uncharacterized membrane protein
LKTWAIIIGIGGLIVIAALIVWITLADAWQTAAYVAIVIVAMFQLLSTLILIALLGALLYAVSSIRDVANQTVMPKVSQTLDQAKETAAATRNTTTYVAESVVSPMIKLSAIAAGVRTAAVTLARRNRAGGYEPK